MMLFPLVMLMASCAASPISQTAICDGTRSDRADHAAALIVDGGTLSKQTGAVLLVKIKAGCSK